MTYSAAAGLDLPPGLNVVAFDAVARRMADVANPNDQSAPERRNIHHAFASAWNGVAFRVRAATDYSRDFGQMIAKTTAPGGEDRLRQETAMFGAISATQSCFECFCMACYAAGAARGAPSFPITAARDLLRYPKAVATSFENDFPLESLTVRLVAAVASSEFNQLQDLRNALAHRGIVPRRHFLSVGSPDRPSAVPSNPKQLALDHAYDAQLSSATTAAPLEWVLVALNPMVRDLQTFLG